MASWGGTTFRVERSGDGTLPVWQPGAPRWSLQQIPGVNVTVKQFGGRDDPTLSIMAMLAAAADLDTLSGLVGTRASLVDLPTPSGLQTFTNTLLVSLGAPRWHALSGELALFVPITFSRDAPV